MLSKFKVSLILVFIFTVIFPTSQVYAELTESWVLSGFTKPESVLFDNNRNVLYVSNVNGGGDEKNGKGFISKVSPAGKIIQLEWVTGIDAPKGLALHGNKLYASDIDQLVEIDIDQGKVLKKYPATGAKFLNDVAVNAAGDVYVSDMKTDTIWILKDGKFSVWLNDATFGSPNGLYVENDRLVVATWGVMTDGYNTKVPGHVKTVSFADKSIKSLGKGTPIGNLDGIEPDGKGNYYVTDWMNGKLFLVSKTGEASLLLNLKKGSADLEFIAGKNLIVIPQMSDNYITAYEVK